MVTKRTRHKTAGPSEKQSLKYTTWYIGVGRGAHVIHCGALTVDVRAATGYGATVQSPLLVLDVHVVCRGFKFRGARYQIPPP